MNLVSCLGIHEDWNLTIFSGDVLEKSYVSIENIEKQVLQWNILVALFNKYIKKIHMYNTYW